MSQIRQSGRNVAIDWEMVDDTRNCDEVAPYSPAANIVRAQTSGRALLRMYFGNDVVRETVSLMGNSCFHGLRRVARLEQWCADGALVEKNGQKYDFLFVEQKGDARNFREALGSTRN